MQLPDSQPVQQWALPWRKALLFFAAWTFVALIFASVSYAASLGQGSRGFGWSGSLRLNLILFYLWGILSPLIFWFSRRYPVDFRPLNTRNLLLHVPVLILCAGGHQFVNLTTHWFLIPRVQSEFASLPAYYRVFFAYGFYLNLIIAALLMIGVHALVYYRRFRASQLEEATLRTQLAHAQLRALKMQLHPHFLFNTLHSISSLVLEDPPKANSMIARLGDFLRLTLDHSEQQLVTLREETEFVRCYLEIEQVRFGDRLKVEYDLEPETLSAEVPHLILQPVVENAIQHAIAPRAQPGRIRIAGRRVNRFLQLEVRDSGPGIIAPGSSAGHGLGLTNVRARLEGLYGAECSFEVTNGAGEGLAVVMRFPFRSDNASLERA